MTLTAPMECIERVESVRTLIRVCWSESADVVYVDKFSDD